MVKVDSDSDGWSEAFDGVGWTCNWCVLSGVVQPNKRGTFISCGGIRESNADTKKNKKNRKSRKRNRGNNWTSPKQRHRRANKSNNKQRPQARAVSTAVPDPCIDSVEQARIRAEAHKHGFEIYEAGYMGLGLRTARPISARQEFRYSGNLILLDVDSETGKYIGAPRDCSYVAELTTADGMPFLVDGTDLRVRSFTAYANHASKVRKPHHNITTPSPHRTITTPPQLSG